MLHYDALDLLFPFLICAVAGAAFPVFRIVFPPFSVQDFNPHAIIIAVIIHRPPHDSSSPLL